MFKDLDVLTSNLVSKLSVEEIYEFSQSNGDYHPALKEFIDNQQFWSDLVRLHFQTRPLKLENAKEFFAGEFLFLRGDFEKAALMGSQKAIAHLVQECINEENYDKALEYSESASQLYGVIGDIICLQVCQAAVSNDPDTEIKNQFLTKGLNYLSKMGSNKENESYLACLESSGWQKTITSRYGNLQGFINKGKEFFENNSERKSLSM